MTQHEKFQLMILCYLVLGIIAITACVYCIVLLRRIGNITRAIDSHDRRHHAHQLRIRG